MKKVITFGTFDLFHYGHLRLLQRAAMLGDELFVGISSDSFSRKKKNCLPVINELERLQIIGALECVKGVFLEESMEKKEIYIKNIEADILVMGDDWVGKFDYLDYLCEVVYLPRTSDISTTYIIEKIIKNFN